MDTAQPLANAVKRVGEKVKSRPLTDQERAQRDLRAALILAVSAFLIVVTISAAATILYTGNIRPAISSIAALQKQQEGIKSITSKLESRMTTIDQKVGNIDEQQAEVNAGVALLKKWNIAKQRRIAAMPSTNPVSSHQSQPVITMKVLSPGKPASNNEARTEDQVK